MNSVRDDWLVLQRESFKPCWLRKSPEGGRGVVAWVGNPTLQHTQGILGWWCDAVGPWGQAVVSVWMTIKVHKTRNDALLSLSLRDPVVVIQNTCSVLSRFRKFTKATGRFWWWQERCLWAVGGLTFGGLQRGGLAQESGVDDRTPWSLHCGTQAAAPWRMLGRTFQEESFSLALQK